MELPEEPMNQSENDEPHRIVQNDLDYLVAKMGLSQRNTELLTLFFKRKKLSHKDVEAPEYQQRQIEFRHFYTVDNKNTLAYCNNVKGLVNKLGIVYVANDWRLSIDASRSSLKAVLLYKTNKNPPIPLAFSTKTTDCYPTLKTIIEKINYNEHLWKILCDFKVMNILRGIDGHDPQHYCIFCDWCKPPKCDHYSYKWKERDRSFYKEPLIWNIDDIALSPLHIQLKILKKFIKVVVKDNDVFKCLKQIFPKLSGQKIKDGTQIYNGYFIGFSINLSKMFFISSFKQVYLMGPIFKL